MAINYSNCPRPFFHRHPRSFAKMRQAEDCPNFYSYEYSLWKRPWKAGWWWWVITSLLLKMTKSLKKSDGKKSPGEKKWIPIRFAIIEIVYQVFVNYDICNIRTRFFVFSLQLVHLHYLNGYFYEKSHLLLFWKTFMQLGYNHLLVNKVDLILLGKSFGIMIVEQKEPSLFYAIKIVSD